MGAEGEKFVCAVDSNDDNAISADEINDCIQDYICPLDNTIACNADLQCTEYGSCSSHTENVNGSLSMVIDSHDDWSNLGFRVYDSSNNLLGSWDFSVGDTTHTETMAIASNQTITFQVENRTSDSCSGDHCNYVLTVKHVCPDGTSTTLIDSNIETNDNGPAITISRTLTIGNCQNTVWDCSLNSNTYNTQDDCNGNCQETSPCTPIWVCPGDPAKQCVNIGSANATNIQKETINLASYENDGTVDPVTGECSGQYFIFSGSPSKCRPSGWATAFKNCCDADEDIVADVAEGINLLGGTLGALKRMQEVYQVVSETLKLYNTALQGVKAINTLLKTEEFADAAKVGFESVVNVTDYSVTITGSSTDAVIASLQSYMATMVWTAVIAVAMHFVMKWLMQSCDQDEIMTAAYDDLGLCHYIDKECTTHSIFGCLQKTKMYCCFNSKLARIVHEQGRQQLTNFGAEGWGDFDDPNCRGFTPEELQMIDFSQIDFSEWYDDIATKTQNEIQNNALQKVQEFHNNIR